MPAFLSSELVVGVCKTACRLPNKQSPKNSAIRHRTHAVKYTLENAHENAFFVPSLHYVFPAKVRELPILNSFCR